MTSEFKERRIGSFRCAFLLEDASACCLKMFLLEEAASVAVASENSDFHFPQSCPKRRALRETPRSARRPRGATILAKPKTKAAVKRKAAKTPTRAAAARPAKAAKKKAATAKAASKPAKASVAKPAEVAIAKVAPDVVIAKAAAEPASAVKTIAAPPAQQKEEPLTLPAAKPAEEKPLAAPVKPRLVPAAVQQVAQRADLPPPDGFTLLVDGHFKNQFCDLSGAKAAASELKSRFPMLRIEIYDGANKARLPA